MLTVPPSSASSPAIAATSRPLPPSMTGQPVVCASSSMVSPNALVSGADSGRDRVSGHAGQQRPAFWRVQPPGQHRGGQQALSAEASRREQLVGQ